MAFLILSSVAEMAPEVLLTERAEHLNFIACAKNGAGSAECSGTLNQSEEERFIRVHSARSIWNDSV